MTEHEHRNKWDKRLPPSTAAMTGDRVLITRGTFAGYPGQIVRVETIHAQTLHKDPGGRHEHDYIPLYHVRLDDDGRHILATEMDLIHAH